MCCGERWFRVEQGKTYSVHADSFYPDDFTAELQLTTAQVVLPQQNPDFSAPKQLLLALSGTSLDIEGEIVGVQFLQAVWQGTCYYASLGSAAAAPFQIQIPSFAGGTYRVEALATNRAGQIIHCAPASFTIAPTNDLFAKCQLLSGHMFHLIDHVYGATREAGEPLLTGSPDARSVCYSWQVPADGEVALKAGSYWSDWHYEFLNSFWPGPWACLPAWPTRIRGGFGTIMVFAKAFGFRRRSETNETVPQMLTGDAFGSLGEAGDLCG